MKCPNCKKEYKDNLFSCPYCGTINKEIYKDIKEVDLNKVIIDREIQRKMEEFGYYDTTTNQGTRQYKIRSYEWILECINNYNNHITTGNPNSNSCPI